MSTLELVMGRQPIFDAPGNIFGYELLFCDTSAGILPSKQQALSPDGVLALVDIGIDRLVARHDLYCRVDREVLLGDIVQVLPADSTVLVADAETAADPELLDRYAALAREGYRVAVDEHGFAPGAESLLELASIARIDIRDVGRDWIGTTLGHCHHHEMRAVALNVDLRQELDECTDMGFDLFQGFLLSRPQIIPGRKLEPGRVAKLRLSTALLDQETDIKKLEQIIVADPAMSNQLLHLAATGAAGGLRRTVRSLREALVLAGWRRLQSWVALLLVADKGETSEEEIAICLSRARMCELVARRVVPHLADAAYTAGMLSSFDVLMHVPLGEALSTLPIDDDLRASVVGHTGSLGAVLADVIDVQQGRWNEAVRCKVDPRELQQILVEALLWASEANRLVGASAGGGPAPAKQGA